MTTLTWTVQQQSLNDNINMDSTTAESVNDNINMDSTISGSVNENINMDSTVVLSMFMLSFTLCCCTVHVYVVIH
jgi:NADH:ubiquinone oxidoreductase subunit B-like Fe-S oxidoreductase